MKLRKTGLVLTAFIFTALITTSCKQEAQDVWIKGSDLEDSDYLCDASGYVKFTADTDEALYADSYHSLVMQVNSAAYGRVTWPAQGNSNYTTYTLYAPVQYALLPNEIYLELYKSYDYYPNTYDYYYYYYDTNFDEVVLYTSTPENLLTVRDSSYSYSKDYFVHLKKSTTTRTIDTITYTVFSYVDDSGKSVGIPEGAWYYCKLEADTDENGEELSTKHLAEPKSGYSYTYIERIRLTGVTFETAIYRIGDTYYNTKSEEIEFPDGDPESETFTYSLSFSELEESSGIGYANITLSRK